MLEQQRDETAQDVYEKYNFGSGVTVVSQDGWEKDGSSDFNRIVYVEFDGAEDSQKISFHVTFKKDSAEIEDVYGLLMSNGSEIGHLPKKTKKTI